MITNEQIVEYYDSCEVDYKNNWHMDECLALHIGYWDNTTRTLPEALIRQNEIMAEMVRIQPQDSVLDAGCGIGGSSIYLTKQYGCMATGITLSNKQMHSATKLAREHGVDKLATFCVMDYTKTDFPDASFDVVWALESSCYASSKKDFINEAYRLLRPKGRLIVADGFESKASYTLSEKKWIDNWVKRWQVDSLASLDNFQTWLNEAGFQKSSYLDISENVTPSSKKLFYRSLLATPFALLLQAAGKRSKLQNDNMYGAIYQYIVLRKNLARYGIFLAEKP